jgi:branched-chain amino acid transport system ATP-binding protein
MMEVLKIRNVAKSFGGLKVLQDVSFILKAGEKVALIGPNGAGKTTLVNVLSGLLNPTSGSITLLGRDVTKLPPYDRVALGLARSFQVSSLFPALSLFSNVLMALYGIQKSRYQMFRAFASYKNNNEKVQELLEGIDLWDKKDMPVSDLSHGEKRQLEIVLSISSRPKVLLLDEPNAGLSSDETAGLIHRVENLAAGTTTLIVAHDLDFIYRLCDRVMVLYYGEIIADGSCQEIQTNQKVCSIYLGTEVKDARVG